MTDPLYKKIGELIKSRRKTLSLNQESLSSTLGISRGSLANIETGKQSILVHQLYKFASALGLRPSDLLPPSSQKDSQVDQTDLPLPTALKGQLKRQVADLIFQVDTSQQPKDKQKNATKTLKR